VTRKWYPLGTHRSYETRRPSPGTLLAQAHAVWRVVSVTDLDRKAWTDDDKANPARPPFRVNVNFVGGKQPTRTLDEKGEPLVFHQDVHALQWTPWDVYQGGRWPQCSCCGEPMPCRAEMQDQDIDAAMTRVEKLTKRMPGCCWACEGPITSRQKSILYVGDNLELPGGPDVRFHLRSDCAEVARRYELLWLSMDHTRRRMLTAPACSGSLMWHQDGTLECVDGAPECQGRTHAHRYQATCYNLRGRDSDPCAKGCSRHGWGCGGGLLERRGRRIEIRDPDWPQGILPDPPAAHDRRAVCPGVLMVHTDGASECIRSGRDDCWGGDVFRHEQKRECHTLSHGCPKCETVEGVL
jgi:hypothetical protein